MIYKMYCLYASNIRDFLESKTNMTYVKNSSLFYEDVNGTLLQVGDFCYWES